MVKKLSNDENIANLKKRKVLKYLLIVFSLLTMILAALSLMIGLSFIYALVTYIVVVILSNKRKNTIINKTNDIYEVEEEIEKVNKRKK